MSTLSTVFYAAKLQLLSFLRAPVTAALALLLPVNLLLLLSLFALTGYRAPTAIVVAEPSALSTSFVESLDAAHHSFDLRPMPLDTARRRLQRGQLVAILEIPASFDADVRRGRTPTLALTVDNVNVDITEDIRRALPAAAVIFADRNGFPEVRMQPALRNVLPEDTGYVEYLGVSAIALAACIAGGVLGAAAVARDWEVGASRLLAVAPGGLGPVLVGRVLAAGVVAAFASLATAAIVRWGYGVPVAHPVEAVGCILVVVAAAVSLGGVLGAMLRRTLPITPLVVGITLPFYLDSGALEPQRFDGPHLFAAAHLSPAYYGVGLLEHAWNGLVVVPEPLWLLGVVLAGISAVGVCAMSLAARR
jgi:hypothetical protein